MKHEIIIWTEKITNIAISIVTLDEMLKRQQMIAMHFMSMFCYFVESNYMTCNRLCMSE